VEGVLEFCRKDVLTARDEKEWERMAANKALTREGVIAGAVADAVAKKKPLNLEEELKVNLKANYYFQPFCFFLYVCLFEQFLFISFEKVHTMNMFIQQNEFCDGSLKFLHRYESY